MAQQIDGRLIAQHLGASLHQALSHLPAAPRLAILCFETPASLVYKNAQVRVAQSLGIQTDVRVLKWEANPEVVQQLLAQWNADPQVHGIFVHQPMPPQITPEWLSALINPRKDVEGIHPHNSARRFFAKARIGSCTALAVMELIESTGVDLRGKEAVVVGHSEIVGRPVGMLLLDKWATTTICHIGTAEAGLLEQHVRRAEVLVVAVGRPNVIRGEWVRPGSIVIDVGINVVSGHVVGDVEFAPASARAAFISPVPGGVGPVTVMMVMRNTLEAYRLQHPAVPAA